MDPSTEDFVNERKAAYVIFLWNAVKYFKPDLDNGTIQDIIEGIIGVEVILENVSLF